MSEYCAVRIEKTTIRTPLPIEHYRRGMEVRTSELEGIVAVATPCQFLSVLSLKLAIRPVESVCVTHWRWPNESEWKPAFTETVEEREVERLEVVG